MNPHQLRHVYQICGEETERWARQVYHTEHQFWQLAR